MKKRFKKLAHSIYECKYHLVFCPKYRCRVFTNEIAEYTKQEIYRLCNQKDGVEVLELNVQKDHVHIVVSLPPKYAVSNFAGYLKGKLAIRLLNNHEKLAKRYWGRHLWSRGYCVTTVGLDEEKIRKYVKWQENREKKFEQQGRFFD